MARRLEALQTRWSETVVTLRGRQGRWGLVIWHARRGRDSLVY